jgi:hypothetical protein
MNNHNMNGNINRQVCAYALGKASELFPTAFGPFAFSVLQVSFLRIENLLNVL